MASIWLKHILRYQRWYLLSLLIVLLSLPVLFNSLQGKPLLVGEESYYHLSHQTLLLGSIASLFPDSLVFILPLLLGIGSLLLFFCLSKQWKISSEFQFCFLLLGIISPVFIYHFSTLSVYGFWMFLSLAGFLLLVQPGKVRYAAAIFFVAAAFTDVFSGVLLFFLLLHYFYLQRKKSWIAYVFPGLVILATIINGVMLQLPLVAGPFHLQAAFPDLISDLGGKSGISLALLLLAFIGLLLSWKNKSLLVIYGYLLLFIIAYGFSTQLIFYLGLTLILFASFGLLQLWQRSWTLKVLKTFTLLLIFLTLLFSTITYLERVNGNAPSAADVAALRWIRENLPEDAVVFSDSQNSYFISYFAERRPFYEQHQHNPELQSAAATIINSTYIDTTFPLLEQYNISVLYLTPGMQERYRTGRGLFFILKNERFKLAYAQEGYEVWEYTREGCIKKNDPDCY